MAIKNVFGPKDTSQWLELQPTTAETSADPNSVLASAVTYNSTDGWVISLAGSKAQTVASAGAVWCWRPRTKSGSIVLLAAAKQQNYDIEFRIQTTTATTENHVNIGLGLTDGDADNFGDSGHNMELGGMVFDSASSGPKPTIFSRTATSTGSDTTEHTNYQMWMKPQFQIANGSTVLKSISRIVQIQDPGDSYEFEDNNKSNNSAITLAPDTGDDNYNQIAFAVFTDDAATATIKAKIYYRLIPNGTTVTA